MKSQDYGIGIHSGGSERALMGSRTKKLVSMSYSHEYQVYNTTSCRSHSPSDADQSKSQRLASSGSAQTRHSRDGTKRRQNVWILASHAFTVIPHPPIDMERVRDQADIYTNEQPDIRPHISTAAPTLIHDIPDIVS